MNMLKTLATFFLLGALLLSSCRKKNTLNILIKDNTENNGANDSTQHYIGQQFGGGIIYHIWKDSDRTEHGLIVTTKNQSSGHVWSNVDNTLIGWSAQYLGDGAQNCNAIINQPGHTNSAAKLCLDLEFNGQNDWYLPSTDEIEKLIQNRYDVNKVLLTLNDAEIFYNDTRYWTSYELGFGSALAVAFNRNIISAGNQKSELYFVRAIRSF